MVIDDTAAVETTVKPFSLSTEVVVKGIKRAKVENLTSKRAKPLSRY